MLNRRYLRIKVYQALYAAGRGEQSGANIEKEMFTSIDRTFDLYINLMMLFGELHVHAESWIEERKKKKLPTEHDLLPDKHFVDNRVLSIVMHDGTLKEEADRRKVTWVGFQDIVNKLYRAVETSDVFIKNRGKANRSFADDQRFLVHLFEEVIADHEPLHDHYEAKSIYWLEDLDLACSMVKRTIENMRESNANDFQLLELYKDPEEEQEFIRTLFRKVLEESIELEEMIQTKSQNWEMDRIAVSDMVLMKMALVEVKEFAMIPIKVTMNEYIEIAKSYSTPKSKNFINGVLDGLFKEMKASGAIKKMGRGLIEN